MGPWRYICSKNTRDELIWTKRAVYALPRRHPQHNWFETNGTRVYIFKTAQRVGNQPYQLWQEMSYPFILLFPRTQTSLCYQHLPNSTYWNLQSSGDGTIFFRVEGPLTSPFSQGAGLVWTFWQDLRVDHGDHGPGLLFMSRCAILHQHQL